MAGIPPGTLRQDELPEYAFVGPFGGVQSEVSPDKIGRSGFADVQNLIFRKSSAYVRPGYTPAPPIPNPQEPIVGYADFFTTLGLRVQVIFTLTRLLRWDGNLQTFINVPPSATPLGGGPSQLMSWDVVGGKLYFSQGVDKVQVWDGATATFGPAAVTAVPGRFLFELDFHLIVANTVEGGVAAPQRVRWTGLGDGTDWTSFNSGQADLFNNLGPINGGCKLFQAGFLFQQWGITQMIPTGLGLAPFRFIPLGSKAKGSICPYALASFGEDIAAYVGKSNIFMFDGTTSNPIGDRPIDGNRRLGARRRIFGDLFQSDLNRVFATITTSIAGNDYEAYWLFFPLLNKAWIYHFDEGSWTQAPLLVSDVNNPRVATSAGVFNKAGIPRIIDLVGTIREQSWSPSTLVGNKPLDSLSIGFNDGVNGIIDFTTVPVITEGVNWSLSTGQLTFDDPRHSHTVKKIRLCLADFGPYSITITLTNEKGVSQSKILTYGTGTGAQITRVVEFSLSGAYITLTLANNTTASSFGMSELALIYDTGGEIRGGTA